MEQDGATSGFVTSCQHSCVCVCVCVCIYCCFVSYPNWCHWANAEIGCVNNVLMDRFKCIYWAATVYVIKTGLYRGPAHSFFLFKEKFSLSSVVSSCMPELRLIIYTFKTNIKHLMFLLNIVKLKSFLPLNLNCPTGINYAFCIWIEAHST